MKLSDINPSDIKVISEPKARVVATPAPIKLSEIDPSQVTAVSEPGLLGKTLETIDRYGGAPMRAAYGKAQDSLLKRGVPLDVIGAAKAAYDQFGKDPSEAPTAEQLVDQNPIGRQLSKPGIKDAFAKTPAMLGLRTVMSPVTGWDRSGEIVGEIPKQAAGLLVGTETDPLTYVPGAVFEKPIAKGFELGGKAISNAGKFGAYLAENTTGIPREVWSNYAKRAKEIGKMAKDYVGESRYMNAYTDFRNQVGDAIAGRKNQLNETIDQGLGGASRGSKISTKSIIDELDNSMRGLHPVTEKSAIDEIQSLKNKVKELAPEGKMSPWDAYKLQRYFHDRSMKAFAEGGAIFNPSSQAAKAAKSARYKTTEIVNQFFPDTIKKANQEFVSLHNIDDMIPPSMLDPNGSAAALRRAALDPNSKERKALTQLSQFLHGDDRLVQQAMDLSTFEKMTNLPINPLSGGGTTSTSRTLLGGGVGLLGEASDDPEMKWAARGAGAMIASPAILKMALDAGLMAPNAMKRVGGKGGLLEKGAEKVSPTMRALEKRLEGAGKTAKEFIKDEEGAFSPDDLFKILKPGEENVFDLKKARGMAGEPKGLLPGEGDAPVAKYSKVDSSVDDEYERLKQLTTTQESTKPAVEAQKNFKPGQVIESEDGKKWTVIDNTNKGGLIMLRDEAGNTTHDYADSLWDYVKGQASPEQPRGLLTSLDVEKKFGMNIPEYVGTPIGSGRLINLNGDIATVEMWDGRLLEIPTTKLSWSGNAVETAGGPNVVKIKPTNSGMRVDKPTDVKANKLTDEELARRQREFYYQQKENAARLKADQLAEEAAEAERMKKGLIGVDFGGRGGKMPKAKSSDPAIGEVWNGPSGKKYTVLATEKEGGKTYVKVEHIDVSGGPNDGKKITTWEEADDPKIFYGRESRGESGPMGKKELVDALMSGKNKVPGINPKRTPPTTEEIWKAFDDAGFKPKPIYEKNGVKIYTKDSNSFGDQIIHYSIGDGPRKTETFGEGNHMDFDTFADIYGPKKKPKGGPGKPKKKK